MPDILSSARKTLKRVFGYDSFIGKQEEVIRQLLSGGSALALMPTGGGKSLCYQLPALTLDGTAIVISPLIALMKDQVDSMRMFDVRAAYLNSSQTVKQSREVRESFMAGELDLLYIAPERLIGGDGLELIQRQKIALVAIDEAHCISQWGHDFRPEYLQLGRLADLLPDTPRLALTATADEQTRQEIIEKLRLHDAQVTIASFDRANIRYSVLPKRRAREEFLSLYRREHNGQSGIIYCLSRRRAEETAEWLEKQGVLALPYHAGMTAKIRQKHQERFLREDGMVMCATIAFGMGINKPDVRFVAHFDLPKSVEGYYQETGRAGRDGLPASAVLYYGMGDAINIRKMIEASDAPEQVRRIEGQKLTALTAFCEAHECRRALLLKYFGETYQAPCDNCDNCLSPPKLQDVTVPAQKLLSAAARSRQLFGATHLIDILIGKETDKVKKFAHEQLPTFGVGGDLPAAQWKRIARQVVSDGIMQPDEHGALKISDKGKRVLKNEEKVFTRAPAPIVPREKKTASGERAQPAVPLSEDESRLFDAMREERQRLAQRQNVPAYVVFHDTVLIELARAQPDTMEAFSRIPGIGAAKTERYAKAFIKIIERERGDGNETP